MCFTSEENYFCQRMFDKIKLSDLFGFTKDTLYELYMIIYRISIESADPKETVAFLPMVPYSRMTNDEIEMSQNLIDKYLG